MTDLIACYWTLAGPLTFGPDDHSAIDVRLRIEAAARAGYRGIGLKHADIMRSNARHGWPALRRLLADNALVHIEVEALGDWWCDGEVRIESDRVRDDLFVAAAELGARHLKVYGAIPALTDIPLAAMQDSFGALCERARSLGTRLVLEPIGCSSIPDLDTALAVIGPELGKVAGLMLDSWHIARSGMSLPQIAALPPGAIGGAEIDDGLLAGDDYLTETMLHRLLPGEGEFDLPAIIAAIRATGYDGPWGVEITSEAQRARSLEDAASSSFTAARRVLP